MDSADQQPSSSQPALGYIEAGPGSVAGVVKAYPDRFARSLSLGRDFYSAPIMALGDAITGSWLKRNATPYKDEIFAIRNQASMAGALMLNMSFEWGCTTCATDNGQGGNRMLRVLDWILGGLGREAVIVKQETPFGPFYNVSWVGFVGCITGMAPGRFSAAINQPPMRRTTNIWPVDWAIEHGRFLRRDAIPPDHLLRHVFETCADYQSARKMLIETPVCIPAFFTLSGTEPDQACCIERLENDAFIHESPATITNHWLAVKKGGYDRGSDSPGRLALMDQVKTEESEDPFGWVRPPILNKTTRLAVVADAALGELTVRAYDDDGQGSAVPASLDFNLSEHLFEAREGA